jgi:hypothetical protein
LGGKVWRVGSIDIGEKGSEGVVRRGGKKAMIR